MLIENLKKEWDKISQEETANLVNSMSRRLQAITDAKGLHTKY
jgi:uncharacterized protein YaaW (UPF0174 family)